MEPSQIAPAVEAVVQTTNGGSIRAASWVTAVSVVVGLLTLIIKQVGPWKKQTTEADEKLRTDMMARVSSLETQVDALRAELNLSHSRYDKIINDIRAQHALEMHALREQHLLDLAKALGRRTEEDRQT